MKLNFFFLSLIMILLTMPSCTPKPETNGATPGVGTEFESASELPFTISLRSIPVDGWRGGHSFATIEYEGQVALVGGRTNGLHNFPSSREDPEQAFPPLMANDQIILLDPASGAVVAQKSVDDLPSPINLHLKSTNAQFASENGWFYYLGGYGLDVANDSMFTMPYVTAIEIEPLIAALKDPDAKLDEAFRNQHIAFIDNFNPSAKITGGDMEPAFDVSGNRIPNAFFLVFGQSFDGMYFASGTAATQVYRNRVEMITLNVASSGGTPSWSVQAASLATNPASIQHAENLPPDNPYHRRDLTVAPSFRPGNGGMAVTAYGGVFKNDLGGFLEPIYIQSFGYGQIAIFVDIAAKQLLSHYKCPVIQMYEKSTETMYSTFFGGISYYYWDPATQKLVRDPVQLPFDGLPFIDSVSTLVATAGSGSATTAQYLIPGLTFPPADDVFDCQGNKVEFLGSETHFIPAEGAFPYFANGVIDVDTWKSLAPTPSVLGYLIGGIAATDPYSARGETCSSNRIYEVTLSLESQPVTHLPIPAE